MADHVTHPYMPDPELGVIRDILKLLETLEYAPRVRVLNYIGARLNKDFD